MVNRWKARIGWIHPRVTSDMEVYDFYRVAPENVVLVVTNLEVVESSRKEDVDASLALLERAVERLTAAGVDIIVTGGSPVHLRYGNEGHRQVLERMRAATKIPVTTSSLVLADAFQHLFLRRILAICSWKPDSLQLENLKNFLRVAGIEIAAVEGIGKQLSSIEKTKLTPAQIYDNALQAGKRHPEVDAVYIQSGTMATADIIEPLENELGKPVLSAHIANIWGSFKPLNIKVGSGYGALLESL
jgi:maleate isomerase